MNGLLIALVLIMMVFGGMAIYRSLNNPQKPRANQIFDSWYEDASGYQKALDAQAKTGQPILLYFYATWCPHCKHFTADVLSKPVMQAFLKPYPHVRIAPDNGPAEQKLMSDFGAPGYPSFYVVLPNQPPRPVDTFNLEANPPRPKTAAEFVRSIQDALKK